MENNSVKQSLLTQYSLEQLYDIYIVNDRSKWNDDAFIAIQAILEEKNISIPKQMDPSFTLTDFKTFSSNEINESIFEEIFIDFRYTSKLKVSFLKFLIIFRRVFIGIFPFLVISTAVTLIKSVSYFSYALKETSISLISIFIFALIIILPNLIIQTLTIEQSVLLAFDERLHITRQFADICSHLISSLEKKLSTARFVYLYAFVTYSLRSQYDFDFLDLRKAIDLLNRNRVFLPNTDVMNWTVGWLHFYVDQFDEAIIEFRKIAEKSPESRIHELIEYCTLRAQFSRSSF